MLGVRTVAPRQRRAPRARMPLRQKAHTPLCVAALLATACLSPPVTTNVPSIRLANGYYTSPAGEFGVRIPKLMVPGTRIEERQIDQTTWSVSFADDFGRIYEVLVVETPSAHSTLEDVARNLPVGGRFSARSFIDTVRGRELSNGNPASRKFLRNSSRQW